MKCDKMILAILQGDDYPDIVRDLNEHGIYLTMLNSSGGFLKKKSVTVLIGVEEEKLDMTLEVLKTHGGSRTEIEFLASSTSAGSAQEWVTKQRVLSYLVYSCCKSSTY